MTERHQAKGIERTLDYLRRLMQGEVLSVPGLLEEEPGVSDGSARRSLLLLEQYVPGVKRDAGRPANWRFVGLQQYRFCPFCGTRFGREE